jgi:hypothetical protein
MCSHGDSQVEKAPVVIKANVSKAEAELLKKQIEAGKTPCKTWRIWVPCRVCVSSLPF